MATSRGRPGYHHPRLSKPSSSSWTSPVCPETRGPLASIRYEGVEQPLRRAHINGSAWPERGSSASYRSDLGIRHTEMATGLPAQHLIDEVGAQQLTNPTQPHESC
jgi:hypothetical protein